MISRLALYYTGPKWAVLRYNVVVLVGAWQKWPANLCGPRSCEVRYTVPNIPNIIPNIILNKSVP
jgi:hypothetical protein